MANEGFNGSTVTWDPTGAATALALGPLLGCDDSVTGAEVPVTGAGDSLHTNEVGIDDESVTVQIGGSPGPDQASGVIAAGQKGALAVAWNEGVGTQVSLANGLLTNLEVSGSLDGPITSSVTVRPTTA